MIDKESLFTSAKWSILKSLETGEKSPLELARTTKTSVSNISQSLRFLELANIVKSERISNRDKGQPRVIYSLLQDYSYIIVTSKNFVEKKLLKLNKHKKTMLRIWFYPEEEKQNLIEEAYLELKESIDDIKKILVEKNTDLTLKIIPREKTFSKKSKHQKITYKITSEEEISKESENHYTIYE